MRYREHAPPGELAPYVTCFWELVSNGEAHRVLPDGAMDLLFALGDAGARVVGPMTRAIVTNEGSPAGFVGVRFRSGAAFDLLGMAARELRDADAEVADVWGPRGRSLDARLAGALDVSSARTVLEAELVARVGAAPAPDARLARAVATLRATGGELPIPAVSSVIGLSERQLERLFDERVGYGQKRFARVVRLQRSVGMIRRPGPTRGGSIASWADASLQRDHATAASPR